MTQQQTPPENSTPPAASAARPKHLARRIVFVAAVLLGLALLALFIFPRQLLTIDTGPIKADVIVMLGGGTGERPQRAAELFREGAAPRIIVSGAGDTVDNKRMLVNRGVPPDAIELEPDSKTTRQNAQFTIPRLRAEGARRVILVTSWYHSRRALKCFRHYGPGIEFFSRPSYFAAGRSEWRRNRMGHFIRSEYVKLLGYCVCYGVSPF